MIHYAVIVQLSYLFPNESYHGFVPSLNRKFVVFLQTHGYFTSPMLKLKPLANAVSLSVRQSNGILSLLISVTFNPPMPSK